MSASTRSGRWLATCAITATVALVALPASAAPSRNNSPFGARALARLAAERTRSEGAVTPGATAQDDDGGNEADEIAPDGSTLYAATHGRGIYTIKVRDMR
ncbi:hypothetical protein ACIRQQ_03095 [Streptomyces fuscichromogenes]|uniref:hypothetical protein n=1 Tax=Streptomyces fuscichromogenes TaxID=1324013 RepID=UPI00380A84D0